MRSAKTVDEYIANDEQWQDELKLLRRLMLSAGMSEAVKWGSPVYTNNGVNIAGVSAFKSYVGIWFFQGALLKDEARRLMNAQEGTTKAQRQWRFNSLSEIETDADLILRYLEEAKQNQLEEKRIKPERNKPLLIPAELDAELEKDKQLRECFDQLSLTNRRDYVEYIATAKRAETRQSRLSKIIPMILAGKGLNDKYKN